MNKTLALVFSAGAFLGSPALAQDLDVSRVGGSGSDFRYYGTSDGLAAYSFGTTSCNVGDAEIAWESGGSPNHPVIAQNFFRIHEGRFEQLGQSWLKHGFCAVNEGSCGDCQDTPCSTLGLGCADTYGSGLNDGQSGGAKSDIHPTSGLHSHPFTQPSVGDNTVRGRLQVEVDKLGLDGTVYLAEAQYVSAHDHLAGNARNNCSWRRINTTNPQNVSAVGATVRDEPAIMAWPLYDDQAEVSELVLEDEHAEGVHGYYFLGSRVTDLGEGRWRYEYALHNMNSERAAGSFSLPVNCDVDVSDVTFQDVDYHSGEVYDNTDWTHSIAGDWIRFETQTPHDVNPEGNALRWGTTYNFGFTATAGPKDSAVAIGLFEPGTPDSLSIEVDGPCGALPCGVIPYCQSAPNSMGGGAVLSSFGSTSLAQDDLVLYTTAAIPGQVGLFFYGTGATETPFGDGFLCVEGPYFRLTPLTADVFGDYIQAIDFDQAPMSGGPGTVVQGDTWFWQTWYRDPASTGAGFNLSNGLQVTFCP